MVLILICLPNLRYGLSFSLYVAKEFLAPTLSPRSLNRYHLVFPTVNENYSANLVTYGKSIVLALLFLSVTFFVVAI